MRKINQLKAGSILSYINLGISCIIPLLYTPIMLNILGQEAYGVYGVANSVIGYLSLLNFGMGSAIIRYITKFRAEKQMEDICRLMGLFISIYGCLTVLVCIAGTVILGMSGTIFGQGLTPAEIHTLRILLVIMTLSTAISFPMGVFGSVVIAFERHIFHKLVCILETIGSPIINLAILYAGFGSIGMAVGGLCAMVVNHLIYAFYCVKKLKVYPVFRNMPTYILKELLGFCAFIFLSSIVDLLYWATDKILIGAVIGSAAVAVYNIGGTFTSMMQNMAHAISGVFSPRVNLMVAKNQSREDLSSLLIRIGRLQYLVVSLILSGYIVFGQDFIRLWAGPAYADAYYIALLTMIPIGVPLIQSIAFATILAENKHRFRSIVYAIIAVVNVASTYLVLPYYGIIGAAACTAVSFMIGQGIVMNIYYYRVTRLDIPQFWKNILRMSIVPGVMIAAGIMLVRYVLPMTSLWWFLMWVAVYTAVFMGLSWCLSLNAYERDLFGSLVKRVIPFLKK